MEERTYLSGTSLAGMSPTRSRVENDYYAMMTLEQTLLPKCSATSTSGKRNMGARPIY